jgi:2-polyprenyl-3-methyl-5-hydroxy-6-metoxy-1,4-benzoquinol methylase
MASFLSARIDLKLIIGLRELDEPPAVCRLKWVCLMYSPPASRFATRRMQPEIMDQPDLSPARLAGALRGLERINWWSGSAAILWRPIRNFARHSGGRTLRLLDLATGAGDVPIRLWQSACRSGIDLQISACDRNGEAVAYARERARRANVPVEFFICDLPSDDRARDCDVVTCSLFLHHLNETQAVDMLRLMGRIAGRLVLVNDLRRSAAGWLLAKIATRLLSDSEIVHTDGPRSVEGAFTIAEVRTLAERAGLMGARVARCWPCRMLLEWERPCA